MITICKPYLDICKDEAFLKCEVHDTFIQKDYCLWYSVKSKYERFLCYEVADPFLLVMLQLALQSHQDIKIEAPVSETLLFNINNSIMDILVHVIPNSKKVKIFAETSDISFNNSGVGCGCSLGVDSFSSILRQMQDDIPDSYKITHLALFNSGQHGDLYLDKAEKKFYEDVENIKPFADKIGLPIVAVNSNINLPYKDYNFSLLLRFVQTTISVVYALQKLFKRYVYASSYPMTDFKLSNTDVSYCEAALVPLLRTQNLEVILANSMMTRVEKTEFIADNELVHKYLDVCWSSQLSNMYEGVTLLDGKTKKNCGKCSKCQRTLLTLEILGHLDEFSEIFDLDEYKKYRWKFITKILVRKDGDVFCREIYELMKKQKFEIPIKCRILSSSIIIYIYRILHKFTGYRVFVK